MGRARPVMPICQHDMQFSDVYIFYSPTKVTFALMTSVSPYLPLYLLNGSILMIDEGIYIFLLLSMYFVEQDLIYSLKVVKINN